MIRVAFDMRDPVRSGIARVARCMPQAFVAADDSGEFEVTVAGPPQTIAELGVSQWCNSPRIVRWDAGRLSPAATLSWPTVNRTIGDATWYFPHWDIPWLARPRRSVALVSDVIPLVVPGSTSRTRRLIARQWIRRTALKASRLALSTEFTRSELIDIWPDLARKTRVVPLGVDSRFFDTPAPLPDPLRTLTANAPYMISVGNRKAHKNLVMGPEVLARVRDIHWLVVGESFQGWDAVTQRAAKLGVADRIHVLGPQTDEVVHALYAGAACLFFPSRNEGFGLPILEALASGTRVVIGRAGACMEVLAGHGAACDLDDPDAFASAVSAAMASGRPGPEGRSHARTYTWERSARVLAKIIREIAQ